jgi:hypothetical protein
LEQGGGWKRSIMFFLLSPSPFVRTNEESQGWGVP